MASIVCKYCNNKISFSLSTLYGNNVYCTYCGNRNPYIEKVKKSYNVNCNYCQAAFIGKSIQLYKIKGKCYLSEVRNVRCGAPNMSCKNVYGTGHEGSHFWKHKTCKYHIPVDSHYDSRTFEDIPNEYKEYWKSLPVIDNTFYTCEELDKLKYGNGV